MEANHLTTQNQSANGISKPDRSIYFIWGIFCLLALFILYRILPPYPGWKGKVAHEVEWFMVEGIGYWKAEADSLEISDPEFKVVHQKDAFGIIEQSKAACRLSILVPETVAPGLYEYSISFYSNNKRLLFVVDGELQVHRNIIMSVLALGWKLLPGGSVCLLLLIVRYWLNRKKDSGLGCVISLIWVFITMFYFSWIFSDPNLFWKWIN